MSTSIVGFLVIVVILYYWLQTRKAKDAIRYYRQVSVPHKAVLYASKPLTMVKINRVELFSISFPRWVDFCFTSQKLNVL